MKYETPKMTALPSAINAIQSATGTGTKYNVPQHLDSADNDYEFIGGYADWE